MGKLDNSTESASTSSEEPPRRLWSCPQGYVGKDQCDASHHNSNCCGYSIPGENCGDRAGDCFCYQWNCHGHPPSWEALPKPDNSADMVSAGSEEPPKLDNSTESARTSATPPITTPIVAAILFRARIVVTAQAIASATSGIAMGILPLGRRCPSWTIRQEPRTGVGIFAACVVESIAAASMCS